MVPICSRIVAVPGYTVRPVLTWQHEHPVARNTYHVTNNNFQRTENNFSCYLNPKKKKTQCFEVNYSFFKNNLINCF